LHALYLSVISMTSHASSLGFSQAYFQNRNNSRQGLHNNELYLVDALVGDEIVQLKKVFLHGNSESDRARNLDKNNIGYKSI
jgi:hypothetical protein